MSLSRHPSRLCNTILLPVMAFFLVQRNVSVKGARKVTAADSSTHLRWRLVCSNITCCYYTCQQSIVSYRSAYRSIALHRKLIARLRSLTPSTWAPPVRGRSVRAEAGRHHASIHIVGRQRPSYRAVWRSTCVCKQHIRPNNDHAPVCRQ